MKRSYKDLMMMFLLETLFVGILLGWAFGQWEVIHSEGWIDFEHQTFVIEVGNNLYEWDISEE